MQLFHTKVIPAATDALWSLPAEIPDFSDKRLLVISTPFETGSRDEQTLHNMMSACKLSADEYSVVQLPPDTMLSWQAMAAAGAPKFILLLGITAAQLAINALFRPNAGNSFLGATFIPSASLAEIEGNPALKKELWLQGLKPSFGA